MHYCANNPVPAVTGDQISRALSKDAEDFSPAVKQVHREKKRTSFFDLSCFPIEF
jgi:hypothetical protein